MTDAPRNASKKITGFVLGKELEVVTRSVEMERLSLDKKLVMIITLTQVTDAATLDVLLNWDLLALENDLTAIQFVETDT